MNKTKPKYSDPCNHCGLCCQGQICEVGKIAFPGSQAPCPGLVEVDGDMLCKLVLIESNFLKDPVIQRTLGIGTGCSMPDEDTTEEEMDEFDRISLQIVLEKSY